MSEEFVDLSLGWRPELAVPGPIVFAADGQLAVAFNAHVPDETGSFVGIVRVPRLLAMRFGHPPGDSSGHRMAEVIRSNWIEELVRSTPHLRDFPLRHIAIAIHDTTLGFVATDLETEVRRIDSGRAPIHDELQRWINETH